MNSMKNILKAGPAFLAFIFIAVTAAAQKDVSLKMGGSYFINCQRTIAFGEQAVITISGDDITGRKVNFDIFSANGTLDASLEEGQFTGRNANFYELRRFPEGFTITDARNGRIVLKIVSVENREQKRQDLHVWADFFLPDGGRFQCTPDESNVPMLQMMKGSTFKNVGTAVQLN
jgi:hypothetical protein